MTTKRSQLWLIGAAITCFLVPVSRFQAQGVKVDLSKETVGKAPVTFEPMVGTWVVAQDGPEKVIKVDGTPWVNAQDATTKLLVEAARKLYGTSNEELMDNAKQFAHYPVAVLRGVDNFSNGTISVKFKVVGGQLDRASGILFNVKPNGDWLCIRYNDTENNVVLWEFHNGVRRSVRRGTMRFPLDVGEDGTLGPRQWHELKMTVAGTDFKAWLDDKIAMEYTFGSVPGLGRNGAAPNPELLPENNPVLRPPMAGRIGLWAKTDSTSYFKDYLYSPGR